MPSRSIRWRRAADPDEEVDPVGRHIAQQTLRDGKPLARKIVQLCGILEIDVRVMAGVGIVKLLRLLEEYAPHESALGHDLQCVVARRQRHAGAAGTSRSVKLSGVMKCRSPPFSRRA